MKNIRNIPPLTRIEIELIRVIKHIDGIKNELTEDFDNLCTNDLGNVVGELNRIKQAICQENTRRQQESEKLRKMKQYIQTLPDGRFVIAEFLDGRYSAPINEEGQEVLACGGVFSWDLKGIEACPYTFKFNSYQEAFDKAVEICFPSHLIDKD